jgi:Tfp pilus assembly protein PilO
MVMLGVFVVSIGVSGAGFYWADQQLGAKSHSVSELLAERDAQNDKIQKLESSKSTAAKAKQVDELISTLLPSQKDQDNLVANIIYTATKTAGLSPTQITNISFSTTGSPTALSGTTQSKDVQGVYVYPFNLQLKDISYTTMLKLFAAFESNQRIIQADQVQITPDKTRAGMISSLTLSLKTFVQP